MDMTNLKKEWLAAGCPTQLNEWLGQKLTEARAALISKLGDPTCLQDTIRAALTSFDLKDDTLLVVQLPESVTDEVIQNYSHAFSDALDGLGIGTAIVVPGPLKITTLYKDQKIVVQLSENTTESGAQEYKKAFKEAGVETIFITDPDRVEEAEAAEHTKEQP